MTSRYQEGYVAGARKTRDELKAEIERLRAECNRAITEKGEALNEIERQTDELQECQLNGHE